MYRISKDELRHSQVVVVLLHCLDYDVVDYLLVFLFGGVDQIEESFLDGLNLTSCCCVLNESI